MDSFNPNIVVEAFYSVLAGSRLIGVIFQTLVILVVIFYVITVVRLYSKKMLGQQMQLREFFRPFGVLLLIVFWKWIYVDISLGTFDFMMAELNRAMSQDGSAAERYHEWQKSLSDGGGITLFNLTFEVVVSWVLKLIVIILNMVFDICLALYIGVNDLILGILGPVALAFSMLDETKEMLVRWFKYFFFFRTFFLLVFAVNYLGYELMDAVAALAGDLLGITVASGNPTVAGGAVMGTAIIGVFCMLVFLIFKILAIQVMYKMLMTFFNVGEGGAGGSAAAMAKGVTSMVKMAVTKGAAK